MPETGPVDIISDAPESEQIEFGLEAYARTIAGLNELVDKPVTMQGIARQVVAFLVR